MKGILTELVSGVRVKQGVNVDEFSKCGWHLIVIKTEIYTSNFYTNLKEFHP